MMCKLQFGNKDKITLKIIRKKYREEFSRLEFTLIRYQNNTAGHVIAQYYIPQNMLAWTLPSKTVRWSRVGQPRSQGFSLLNWVGNPIQKGKALGTRLRVGSFVQTLACATNVVRVRSQDFGVKYGLSLLSALALPGGFLSGLSDFPPSK